MFIAIFCTCPDNAIATKLATKLVTAKLAACVNIIPGIQSIYSWEQQLTQTTEHLLIIKTKQDCYNNIEKLLKQDHPYACPEIIATSITQGNAEYLTWLATEVT